jgi:hypothetical protein
MRQYVFETTSFMTIEAESKEDAWIKFWKRIKQRKRFDWIKKNTIIRRFK